MSTGDPREVEGQPNAAELYAAHIEAGGHPADAGWPRFCASADYCTTPCSECGREARLAAEAAAMLAGKPLGGTPVA